MLFQYTFHNVNMLKRIIFLTLITVFSTTFLIAGTLQLDTTFNGTGYQIQQISGNGSGIRSIALQSDGKIVLAGNTGPVFGVSALADFSVLRVNSAGILDSSFDQDGIVTTNIGTTDSARKVVIQPDGKILVGGDAYTNGNFYHCAVARYNTDGTLDDSFDFDGIAIPKVGNQDRCNDIVLQPDGKILMVGVTSLFSADLEGDFLIIRLNSTGSFDNSFGSGGFLTLDYGNSAVIATRAIIQTNGKIIVGHHLRSSSSAFFTFVIRINPIGTVDTSFGNNGIKALGDNYDIRALALQNDGKILVAGSNTILRLNANGSSDNTFGVTTPTGVGAIIPQGISQIIVLSDNTLSVSGTSGNSLNERWMMVTRLTENGLLDTSFNNTGSYSATNFLTNCYNFSMAYQDDNKIVLGGACVLNNVWNSAVFRLKEIPSKPHLDFDGDAKTDISIFRPSLGQWWYNRSSDSVNRAFSFGSSTDKIVPADYTGDGKTDIATFTPATGFWNILRSEDSTFYGFPFGAAGDIATPADYDGDGKADAAIFRPSNSTWFISKSSGGTTIQQFGASGDKPVVADYDGDGKADIAIYRVALGQWWHLRSSDRTNRAFQFGTSTDKPIQGDYTGDGKADLAFFRPSTGEWFILRSEDSTFYGFPFGTNGDIPASGDYDGDGKFDAAVFRPSNTTWYLNRSTSGIGIVGFGTTGDQPVPNAFVP